MSIDPTVPEFTDFSEAKKRLERLNEVALAAYVKAHAGAYKRISDPRMQGVNIERIAIGMLYEEKIDLDRIWKKMAPVDELWSLRKPKAADKDDVPKNFRPNDKI